MNTGSMLLDVVFRLILSRTVLEDLHYRPQFVRSQDQRL